MRVILLVFCLFGSLSAFAADYVINEKKRIIVPISSSEPNRVRVENDRILEVIGLDDTYFLESDEKLGQIFIKADEGGKDAVFTIITEKGVTQDLKLVRKEKLSSQVVILKLPEDKALSGKVMGAKHARHDEIVAIIKDSRKIKASGKGRSYEQGGLQVKLSAKQLLGSYRVEIWELQNVSNSKITLDENQFSGDKNVAAIMIEDRELSMSDSTKLYKIIYNGSFE